MDKTREGGNVLGEGEGKGVRGDNDIGGRNGVRTEGAGQITVTCEKNTSEKIEAATDRVIWFPGLGKGG